jgi:hypothetical protein
MIDTSDQAPGDHRHAVSVTLGDGPGWAVMVNQDRSASLVVRVWLEVGADEFRARLTSVDTSAGCVDGAELTVGVASSPEDVIALVRAWLTRIRSADGQQDTEPS